VGLNNLLIVPGAGSKVFLAEILWTADARPSSEPMRTTCEGCGACVKACPGRALDGCGGLDARRCLSYLTIEHRGEFPEGLSLAGRRIYGCDVCQDVCPHNSGLKNTILPSFAPSDELMALTLEEAADISDEDFRRIFRRSAVKRTKAAGLRRNAAGAKPGKIV
ncbi:MAG: 4Fe-4S binding protein, partial [Muribaculaceae bacterium]|nr:4Fe-4S binding protein [Muribaculaceae bacterium]